MNIGPLENRLFKLLQVQQEAPSFDFLQKVVRAHSLAIPYENLTKLIRLETKGPTLPDLQEYVEELEAYGLGGTCFTQNIFFNHLLRALGFDANLIAVRDDGKLRHPNIRVLIDGIHYFVDLGIMSSFAGPFELNPNKSFTRQIGDYRFFFAPHQDSRNYDLKIFRGEKLTRSFQSDDAPPTNAEIHQAVEESFHKSALFMTTFCIYRCFADHDIGIWNTVLYTFTGTEVEKTKLQNFNELEVAFRENLRLPRAPIKKALAALSTISEIDIFPKDKV